MALEILQVAVAPKGDVFSLQTGGRIVRHGNPKTGDAKAEVVYEGRERLDGFFVSASGAIHAVGKRYHTNARGKWHAERVPLADDLTVMIAVWAATDDDVWVGSEEGEVLRRRGDVWSAVKTGLPGDGNMIYVIRGTKNGGAYVGSDEGVAYFDGKKWAVAKLARTCLYQDVLVREKEPCLFVGRDGPNLFAGHGTSWKPVKGLTSDASEDFYSVAARGKDVFIATGERLLAWDGRKVRDALPPDVKGYLNCMYVASNGDVVAATSSKGVYASTNGKDWTFHEARPAPGKKKVVARPAPSERVEAKKTAARKQVSSTAKRFERSP